MCCVPRFGCAGFSADLFSILFNEERSCNDSRGLVELSFRFGLMICQFYLNFNFIFYHILLYINMNTYIQNKRVEVDF